MIDKIDEEKGAHFQSANTLIAVDESGTLTKSIAEITHEKLHGKSCDDEKVLENIQQVRLKICYLSEFASSNHKGSYFEVKLVLYIVIIL